ncbi:hypothetical protein C8J57DRAFT_1295838, partial [Mycena rebaudengoi]
ALPVSFSFSFSASLLEFFFTEGASCAQCWARPCVWVVWAARRRAGRLPVSFSFFVFRARRFETVEYGTRAAGQRREARDNAHTTTVGAASVLSFLPPSSRGPSWKVQENHGMSKKKE